MTPDTFEASIRELLVTYGVSKGIATVHTPDDVLKDSLDIVEFVMLVEEKFDLEIADSGILTVKSNSLAALAGGLYHLISPAHGRAE